MSTTKLSIIFPENGGEKINLAVVFFYKKKDAPFNLFVSHLFSDLHRQLPTVDTSSETPCINVPNNPSCLR